ncbi:hypothetical protein MCAP1_003397 [Malassezia caprae]|uniref:WLM domain-containing protein n=1 Tax=Malassezia caprae TaxID=1381934 RepID=A0AAF0EAX1_9BASI|nr:hypothetical protein MCAP1_003397 [Malassezia caprae]
MPVRGRGAWAPALHEEHPGGVIQKYVALRKPGSEKAIALLKDIGQSVKTLIQLRGWRLNYNNGQKICLRLRDSTDPAVFLSREEILRTHNVRGPHDTQFYEALRSLTSEYETAQRLGYWPGAGFLSAGTQEERRRLASEAAARRRVPPVRLGGTPVPSSVPMRILAAEAALRRQQDAKTCASASQDQVDEVLAEMQGEQDAIEVLDSDDDEPVLLGRGTQDDPIVME